MKSKASEKFSIMLSISDDSRAKDIEEYLSSRHLSSGILFMGKGTAESQIADLFGFGLSDRCIVAVLVRESVQDVELRKLTDFLGIEKDTYGLSMLIPVSSATSVVLEALGISVG